MSRTARLTGSICAGTAFLLDDFVLRFSSVQWVLKRIGLLRNLWSRLFLLNDNVMSFRLVSFKILWKMDFFPWQDWLVRLESVPFEGFEFFFEFLILWLKLLDLLNLTSCKLIVKEFVFLFERLIFGLEFTIFLHEFSVSDLNALKSGIAFDSDLGTNPLQHDQLNWDGKINVSSVIKAIGMGLIVFGELGMFSLNPG